jgi:hypothetical protein
MTNEKINEYQSMIQNCEATLLHIKKNYELFVASGCSVHAFNKFKCNAEYYIDQAKIELENNKDAETFVAIRRCQLSLNDMALFVGKRMSMIGKEICTNYGKSKDSSDWKHFCIDCDK